MKSHKEHPGREQVTSPSFLSHMDDTIMAKTSLCDWRFRVPLQSLCPVGADIVTNEVSKVINLRSLLWHYSLFSHQPPETRIVTQGPIRLG